jgi:tRNA(Ile)-lysidine synthase
MLDSFLTFINQQNWRLAKQKTLLAVSGGVDSVVMMHLFHKAGFDAIIAHCNFGLRAQESDEDENFVRALADNYGYPIYVQRFETKSFAKKNKISTQMAARDLRYGWFGSLIAEHSCEWIATAHHLNDSLETSLLNLSRGTGLAGVPGISPEAGKVIHPLLFATRSEIQLYLEQNLLVWREDQSNATIDYKRNRIRHQVIPVLKELNPSLEQTFKITSSRLRAADGLLTNFMAQWMSSVIRQVGAEVHIDIESLLAISEPTYGLWFILDRYGFSYQQVQPIIESLHGVSGKMFHSAGFSILKNREFLIVKELSVSPVAEELIIDRTDGLHAMGDLQLVLGEFKAEQNFEPGKSNEVAFFDRNKLVFPLIVRLWKAGDVFCPFGMGGKSKKVSDLLINGKLSLFEKQKVHVLLNGSGEIIWVVGIRTDERFKVTHATANVLKITLASVNG